MPSDDDIYNDVLDESFEFDDDDYDDVDLSLDSDIDGDDYDDFSSDDYDDELGVEDGAVPSSRKGFNLDFNTIVIIGAVVVGGIIMMYQVTSKKPASKAQSQEKFATALQMNGAFEGPGAIEEKAVVAPKEVDVEDGFLFDSDSIDVSVEDAENALPMPSPITVSSDEILQVSEKDSKVETSNNAVGNDVENIEIAVTKNVLPVIEPEVVVTAPEDVLPVVEPKILVTEAMEAEPVVQEPQIVEVESVNMEATKLQSLLSRIEMMEVQMSEVQQNHRAEIRSLEEKIASLKKAKDGTSKQRSNSSQVQKSKVSKKTASVKKRWELRAAQPGRAWVALKGQNDMRPIVVGDKLSGIGRIQNITYVNGKWIVQGSTGKIAQ